MAQYDRSDLPDENNTNFYVDEFGESLKGDEALPERGEQPAEEQFTFYEQSPDGLLKQAYPTDPADLMGDSPYTPSYSDDDNLRDVFDEDQAA